MKTYERYKPSGVNWIGDVPEHWEVKRLKFFAKVNSSISSLKIDVNSDKEVVFLPMEKVSEGGVITQDLRKRINEVNSGFTYFEKGDVILAKITPCFENGKGALLDCLKTDFGFGSTEFHTIRVGNSVSAKLLFFITKSHQFRTLGEAFMSGSAGQKRVSAEFVKDFQIALPPLPEQTAIAKYLDDKTAQIDKLITGKQRLIALLKEERSGVINKAVTRGINPHAKLKPSGIDWLGDIPEHWKVKKLKYVCELLKDGTHLPPPRVQDGIPLLSVRNLVNGRNIQFLDDDSRISEEDFAQLEKVFKVKENDILLAVVGATMGKASLVPKMSRFTIQRSVAIFRAIEKIMYFKFLFYFFLNDSFQSILWNNTGFSAQPGIYLGALANFSCSCPSTEEQKQIVYFIEAETNKIDATVSKIEKEIEHLQEYRTALISEVVTGKIKVV